MLKDPVRLLSSNTLLMFSDNTILRVILKTEWSLHPATYLLRLGNL